MDTLELSSKIFLVLLEVRHVKGIAEEWSQSAVGIAVLKKIRGLANAQLSSLELVEKFGPHFFELDDFWFVARDEAFSGT